MCVCVCVCCDVEIVQLLMRLYINNVLSIYTYRLLDRVIFWLNQS